MRNYFPIFSLMAVILLPTAGECGFWVASGQPVPEGLVIEEVLNARSSLKYLGKEYRDGWSAGYSAGSRISVDRGSQSAYLDPNFDTAVTKTAGQKAQIVFAHLRQANSGCIKGVVDPHPFKRVIDGKTWLFGHNGMIPKETLMQLIGPEYLKENPPEVCAENPPDTWIDSELYFIFLLKMIDENAKDMVGGIKAAVTQLNALLASEKKGLNFFLTDGQTVWAYRNGMSLYYRYEKSEGFTVISSDKGGGSWSSIDDNELVIVTGNQAPQVTKIAP